MPKITADEVRARARALKGNTLETLARKSAFKVEVHGEDLVYIPASTQKPRSHEKKILEKVCSRFNQTQSFRAKDYKDITVCASYTLAIIANP